MPFTSKIVDNKLGWHKLFSSSSIAIIFAVIFVLITYRRLYFGVDFTDEAFYVAVPYRIVLGDRPFIDELNLIQTSSFLIYPFIKLYIWLAGSTDGIILFMRHIYLLFTFLIAGSVFLALKKNLGWKASLLISLTSIAFIPFNIPNPSYNTLGSGFFTIGCFLGLWVVLNNKNPNYLLLSGLSHGLAVISYPTLFIPTVFYLVLFLFLLPLPVKRLKALTGYCIGALIVVFFLIPILINAGLHNLQASFDYSRSIGVQGGGIEKIIKVLSDLYVNFPQKTLTVFLLIGAYIGLKKHPAVSKYALLLFPLVPLNISGFFGDHFAPMRYVSYYGLLAPYFLLFIEHKNFVRVLFDGVWIPSFVAGMTTAWSSGNGYINAAIGLFPASLVTSVFLIILFLKFFPKTEMHDLRLRSEKLCVFFPILVVSVLLIFQYSSVYRDDKIPELNAKVEFGPYKGLYTTLEKNKYINDLDRDINVVAESEGRILVYDGFPAGYLLTSMRPATNTLWLRSMSLYPNINRQATVDYYQKNDIKPYIAVKVKKIFIRKNEILNLEYPENDPINNMITSSEYNEALFRENYSIYLKAR